MAQGRSLTRRLIALLVLVQTGVAIAGMTAWMLFSPFVSFEDVASETARALAVESLREENAGLVLRPGDALRAYARRRPALAIAVLRDNRLVPGSAPALEGILSQLGPVLPRNGQIDVRNPDGGGLVRFAALPTRWGELVVATRGDRFGWDDASSFLGIYLAQLLPLFGPAVLMAGFVVPLVVRRTLRPLVDASRVAKTIELDSLDRRMALADLPTEIAPLGQAVNELLARLEEGVSRQRLFSANAAHELRTPVAILEARIDAMAPGPDRLELKRSAARIAILLNQLLAVARLGQREIAIDETLDAVALVRGVVADCAPLALRRGRAITFETSLARTEIRANRQALSSALANIVDNAASFEPERGCVVVRLNDDGDASLVIAVEDHGPGIPAEERSFIFEPFWRKDEARPGSGLGLSIAAEIARLHQGALTVAETPGGGATFALRLPRAPELSSKSRQTETMWAG